MKINKLHLSEKKIAIIAYIVFGIIFCCNIYGDVLITTVHGIRLWDCILDGSITKYYEYNKAALLTSAFATGEYSAYYDFFIYIIFGVWNFPLWALGRVGILSDPLMNPLGILWAKSITLPFLFLCLRFINKMIRRFEASDNIAYLIDFSFITSIITVAYLGMVGQYDIIVLAFILGGMYYCLEKRWILFVTFFSLAMWIKMFAFFPFIVLVLLHEKDIFKDILSIAVALIPMFISRHFIPFATYSNTDALIFKVFESSLPIPYGNSTIVILLVIICVFSYTMNVGDCYREQFLKSNYLILISYIVFFVGMVAFPYWYMYIVPFLVMSFLYSTDDIPLFLIEEMIMSFCVVLAQFKYFFWVVSSHTLSGTILGEIIIKEDNSNVITLNELFIKILGEDVYNENSGYIIPILVSIFSGILIIYLIQANPFSNKTIKMEKVKGISLYGIMIIRIIFMILVALLPVIEYYML